jgi:hypothetical protein
MFVNVSLTIFAYASGGVPLGFAAKSFERGFPQSDQELPQQKCKN